MLDEDKDPEALLERAQLTNYRNLFGSQKTEKVRPPIRNKFDGWITEVLLLKVCIGVSMPDNSRKF